MKISKIILYDEPAVPEINLSNLEEFIKKIYPVQVETRKNIFKFENEYTAQQIASCKIFNTRKPFQRHTPTIEEIDFEKNTFEDSTNNENIVMYDGFEIQKKITELISEDENREDYFHLIFTNKLTCTYDYNDYRYHGRAVIGANPAIISMTGVIEAPAKPREYYMGLMTNYTQGINLDLMKKKFQGTYLEYHDKRLPTIVEGYFLQALFYYLTAEPFCDNLECRLFNAHWQKDLLHSQLEVGKLCDKHQKNLDELVKDLNYCTRDFEQ